MPSVPPAQDGVAGDERPSGLILVGGPNAGKSVIFGVLTGRYAMVSNYPGTTVEISRGRTRTGGNELAVVDTPGVNSLLPRSEDEQVTRNILMEDQGVVVQVGDAKNLARALSLSFQIAEAGRRSILLLNMSDEAAAAGIAVDAAALSEVTGIPVLETVAVRKKGTSRILPTSARAAVSRLKLRYPAAIEEALSEMEPLLPPCGIGRRAMALMLLAGDESLAPWIQEQLSEEQLARIEEIRHRVRNRFSRPLAYVINEHRMRAAVTLAGQVTCKRRVSGGRISEKLDLLTMHPVWSVPALLATLVSVFLFVGYLGAGTGVDLLETQLFGKSMATLVVEEGPGGWAAPEQPSTGGERRLRVVGQEGEKGGFLLALEEASEEAPTGDGKSWTPVPGGRLQAYGGEALGPLDRAPYEVEPGIFRVLPPRGSGTVEIVNWTGLINPAIYNLCRTYLPAGLPVDLIVGRYGLITMGLTYAVAIVLPIIITFFLAFSFLEDSGYLPRLAVVFNRLLRVIGLNGKAVLPLILGLGCDTMATLTTRILASRKERLIAILLLALGVPCSAQLGVILGLLSGLSWKAAAIWAGVLACTILLVGFLASRLIPGTGSDFILEIPPLRFPSARNIGLKTLARVEWYLKEAVPIFLIGTLILFVADRTGLLAGAQRLLEPVIVGLLDLPGAATDAFIIGFLRRDFGAAGLFVLADAGQLTPVQLLVSIVTMTLFIPCVANFLMIVKERGLATALAVAGFIFPFALLVGGGLSFALNLLQVRL